MGISVKDEPRRADSLCFRISPIAGEWFDLRTKFGFRLDRTEAARLYHSIGRLLFDDEKAPRIDV